TLDGGNYQHAESQRRHDITREVLAEVEATEGHDQADDHAGAESDPAPSRAAEENDEEPEEDGDEQGMAARVGPDRVHLDGPQVGTWTAHQGLDDDVDEEGRCSTGERGYGRSTTSRQQQHRSQGDERRAHHGDAPRFIEETHQPVE